jgi:type IV secretion system protein TrbL
MRVSVAIIFILSLIGAIFIADNAYAQSMNSFPTELLKQLENHASTWEAGFTSIALALFKLTLILEVALFGIKISLRRTQLQDVIAEFVTLLIFAGFIAAVILNYKEWSSAVVNGLQQIGRGVGISQINASDPLQGVKTVIDHLLFQAAELTDLDDILLSFMLVLTAGILLLCFLGVACIIILIKAEFIVLGNVAIIIIGLGGSKIFKDYAINVMRYIFSVGVKLLVLESVVKIGINVFVSINFATYVQNANSGQYAVLLMAMCLAILILVLSIILPQTISGLIQGSQIHSGNPLASAGVAAGKAAVSAGASAAGAVAAGGGTLMAANTLAKQQSEARKANPAAFAGEPQRGRISQIMHNISEARKGAKASNSSSIKGQLASKSQQVQALGKLGDNNAKGSEKSTQTQAGSQGKDTAAQGAKASTAGAAASAAATGQAGAGQGAGALPNPQPAQSTGGSSGISAVQGAGTSQAVGGAQGQGAETKGTAPLSGSRMPAAAREAAGKAGEFDSTSGGSQEEGGGSKDA